MPTTPTQRSMRAALRVAREVYEAFCERTAEEGPFRYSDYRAAVAPHLAEFVEVAFEGFVDKVCEKIDGSKTREDDSEQPLLFDMGRVLKLGDGRRQPQRYAMIQHYDEWLTLHDANLAANLEANRRLHHVRELLAEYWPMGTPMQRAVEAYLRDHPEAADGRLDDLI